MVIQKARVALERGDQHGYHRVGGIAAILGLSAGALGIAELAYTQPRELQTVVLPDHYRLLSDNSLVLQASTGERYSLASNQYVQLQGGIVVVVDDAAVSEMKQIPLIGTLETHILTDAEPVRSANTSSILETTSQTVVRSGEGITPRLFQEVNIHRQELAQNRDDSTPQFPGGVATATAAGAGAGVLLFLLFGEESPEPEPEPEPKPEPEPEPERVLELQLAIDIATRFEIVDGELTLSSDPSDLTVLDDKLYFAADGPELTEYRYTTGRELWAYDPSTGTATEVADIVTGRDSSSPDELVALNGKLYFTTNDATDSELWEYDPNTGIASEVADINAGAGESSPDYLVALNGKLYFSADDGTDSELWEYDPNTGIASEVADINAGAGSSSPYALSAGYGKLYFGAKDNGTDHKFWVYNPLDGSTSEIDVNGRLGSYITALDGKLYFSLYFNPDYGTDHELWVYDPANGSTSRASSMSFERIGEITAFNGNLYFRGDDGTDRETDHELWEFDPTSGSTSEIEINRVGDAWVTHLTVFDDKLYFTAFDGIDEELWFYG